MNQKSQSKIRQTQKVNLLAENRYLKSKGLLREGIEEIESCFAEADLKKEEFSNCNPLNGGGDQKIDLQGCVTQVLEKAKDKASDPKIGEKITTFISCSSKKVNIDDLLKNVDLKNLDLNNVLGTGTNLLQKGLSVATDSLNKLFGGSN